jgi:serine beta-lactamase-like protein LACTB, mitochondrial
MRQLLLAVLFAVSVAAAQPPARYPLPLEAGRLARAIGEARTAAAQLVDAKRIPGFSIAVGVGGTIVWSEGFGLADVEQQVAVTPLTRFRLGSVSKMLTAAGLARLVEQAEVDLDAPVQRYVPAFPEKRWPITTRQLAGHLAGIRHYLPTDFTGPLKGAPHFESVSQALAIFQNDPLLFEPGTKSAYSSYGWNLISAVIEGASKQEFLAYMAGAVFEPLGLRSIAVDHVYAFVPHRTRFYQTDPRGALLHAPYVDNSYKWASGGFVATPEDLVRFGAAHMQPGFLRQSTLDLLFTSQRLRSGEETGVGIGWRIGRDRQGRRILHHAGTIEGGRTVLMMFPDAKVVVAMAGNALVDFGEEEAMRIGGMFIQG